jgi:hypothetical protein
MPGTSLPLACPEPPTPGRGPQLGASPARAPGRFPAGPRELAALPTDPVRFRTAFPSLGLTQGAWSSVPRSARGNPGRLFAGQSRVSGAQTTGSTKPETRNSAQTTLLAQQRASGAGQSTLYCAQSSLCAVQSGLATTPEALSWLTEIRTCRPRRVAHPEDFDCRCSPHAVPIPPP